MLGGTLKRHTDGTVTFPGIDHGGPGKILAENEKIVAIKWPKGTVWCGIGMDPSYFSPHICVYARTVKRSGHKNPPIENMKALIEWDVTRKKKKEEK